MHKFFKISTQANFQINNKTNKAHNLSNLIIKNNKMHKTNKNRISHLHRKIFKIKMNKVKKKRFNKKDESIKILV